MKTIFCLLCLLLSFAVAGQVFDFPHPTGKTYRVMAPSGLQLRATGSLMGATLATIPYNDIVHSEPLPPDTQSTEEWVAVNWGRQQGYVHSDHLQETEGPVLFSLLEDWTGQWEEACLPADIAYFGLYPSSTRQSLWPPYEFRKIKGRDTTLYDEQGWAIAAISLAGTAEPYFIIAGMKPAATDPIRLGDFRVYRRFPPGAVYQTDDLLIYATGQIVINAEAFNPVSHFEDYAVRLRGDDGEGGFREQLLYKADRIASGEDQHVVQEVYIEWFGDLDSDGLADVIMVDRSDAVRWETRLYLSSHAGANEILGLAGLYTIRM